LTEEVDKSQAFASLYVSKIQTRERERKNHLKKPSKIFFTEYYFDLINGKRKSKKGGDFYLLQDLFSMSKLME